MRCGEWQRERKPTAKADRARRSACNGHRDVRAKSIEGDGAKINHLLRNFCSASFARPAAGAVRAVVMRDPRDVSPLPLGRLASPHWQRKKVLRTVHALPSHQTMPHYSPSCKYIQLSRQSSPAKRARDGIEWILRVPARPSRHPSVCARAESMTFRCFFVWPYKSSTPGRLLRLSLPCTHLPSYKLSSAGQRTLIRSHIHSANISLTPETVDLLGSHLT